MIARIWHGRVPTERAEDYYAYLQRTGLADYAATPGNRGIQVLRHTEGAVTHFLLTTLWDSMEPIRLFAGDEPERARYYPEDDDYLVEREPVVVHYEVLQSAMPPTDLGATRANLSRAIVAAVRAVLAGTTLVACASPAPSDRQAAATKPAAMEQQALTIEPRAYGHVDVNGFRLYHEIYGTGEPLVLLHGGLMTIQEMSPLVQALARERQVIAVELQGHGSTADTDRPLHPDTMADDIAALLEHLDLAKADFVGYSLGAAVALRTAFHHPERVRRLVVLSTPYARGGWYSEVLAGTAHVNAGMASLLTETPTAIAARDWPQPERFPRFLDKLGALMAEDYDWSTEVRRLRMPVLLIYADHDAISPRHIGEFFALLGGGLADPGWQDTQLTNARLAILPGYSHYDVYTAPELGPIIGKFLADPRTKLQ